MIIATTENVDAAALSAHVCEALAALPEHRWPSSVLVIRPSGATEISTRAELAAWFRANALVHLAKQVEVARVPDGRILVYLDTEGADAAIVLGTPSPLFTRLAPPRPAVFTSPMNGAIDPRLLARTSRR